MKRIAFGCDHVGIILKDDILAHLRQRGIDVVDKGAWSTERTDYPRYASAVAPGRCRPARSTAGS